MLYKKVITTPPFVLFRHFWARNNCYKGQFKNIIKERRFSSGCNSFRVYGWGLSEHGALGLNQPNRKTKNYKYLPKPVRHFFAEENKVTDIECGYGFSVFTIQTKDKIKVYGSGINTDSQIGYHDPRSNHPLGLLLAPAPIELCLEDPDTKVKALGAGRAHLVVVTDKEGVFTLGSNCYGQCGRPIIEEEKYSGSKTVHKIFKLGGEPVSNVVCGQDHTLFLNSCGKVYSCGWGSDGQTGIGEFGCVPCPTRVRGDIECEVIKKVTGKSDCVLALNENGEVFGWGNSEYGQISDCSPQVPCPTEIEKLRGLGKIVDIAAGGSFCMVLNECGDVYVWGYGILGSTPKLSKLQTPELLPRTLFGCNEFQPHAKVVQIACGLSHLAAINNFCDLYTWGRNRSGCLGIGHIRDQYFPYKVCVGALVKKVSCGLDHTMVLASSYN